MSINRLSAIMLFSEIRISDGVNSMNISYKKLWKLLIDRDMKKRDLQIAAGISSATITKMSKSDTVSTDVLMRICKVLHCDIGDIMEFIEVPESYPLK